MRVRDERYGAREAIESFITHKSRKEDAQATGYARREAGREGGGESERAGGGDTGIPRKESKRKFSEYESTTE